MIVKNYLRWVLAIVMVMVGLMSVSVGHAAGKLYVYGPNARDANIITSDGVQADFNQQDYQGTEKNLVTIRTYFKK